jgi:hypothetical protein
MAINAVILRDIQLHPDGPIYKQECSRIEYDPRRAVAKKTHRLVCQHGADYGAAGDCEAYISHSTLMRLVAEGKVRLNEERKPRARKPELAEILYEAWRREFEGITAPWNVVTPNERKQWEAVADAAKQWAYENIQWEEQCQ